MQYGAIDLHKRSSHVCLAREDGAYEEFTVATEAAALRQAFEKRPRLRLVLEASTESEWVARLLESLGHEPIVADPGFALMYATRSRRIKTDSRDARALCDACRLGNYRPAHRTSEPWRQVRRELTVRDALVRCRTRLINVVRALVRQEGLRIGSGAAERFVSRVKALEMPAELKQILHPLLRTLRVLDGRIGRADARLAKLAAEQERVRRFTTAPGVGVVTALAYAAVVEPAERFGSSEQVTCYLGLVPSEDSSSERRRLGSITLAGNAPVRWLLVEAGWRILRSSDEEAGPLRRWGQKVAARRGKAKAAVAVARKLAARLWAMDRDRCDYQACVAAPVGQDSRKRRRGRTAQPAGL